MKKYAVFFVIAAAILAFLAIALTKTLRAVGEITVSPDTVNTQDEIKTIRDRFAKQKPFTILLLGYAGGSHDGTYLTDSIILAHIDTQHKAIRLISIPRDIWISIPTKNGEPFSQKLNSAYFIGTNDKGYPNKDTRFTGETGGSELVKYAVSQITGITADYFLAIDFDGFKKTIDTLGGVDVTVDKTFDDYAYPLEKIDDESCGHSEDEIKEFTATVSAESQLWEYFSCRYRHLHFDAGLTHMDGDTALAYVRSRHSAVDGSDFGRAKRQRNLIVAVKDKILSPGFIPKILPFMESLGQNLKTDLSLADLKDLLQESKTVESYEIHTYALTDKNFLNLTFSDTGASILAPKEGIGNWEKIHTWVDAIILGKPYQIPAIVQVENATSTPGLGIKATQSLNAKRIQTIPAQNSKTKLDQSEMTVFDKNIDANEISVLINEFGIKEVFYGTAKDQDYNVLVKIGKNYTAVPTK